MSMSGGIMANSALDAALDELGMLSTATNSRQEFMSKRQLSDYRLRSREYDTSRIQREHRGIRPRTTSMIERRRRATGSCVLRPNGPNYKVVDIYRRSRTRSENESELADHLPYDSVNQHPCLEPVPYIALPIDSVLSSNLFKSRSMESIDARTSDESASVTEKELSDTVASLAEVDSVSSGLHRLNVSE